MTLPTASTRSSSTKRRVTYQPRKELAMKLDEWRTMQAGGEEATLPSGLEIRVRYVSVLDLALAGAIPQTLSAKVEQIMKGGQVRAINLKEFKEFAELINLVCAECIVSPGRD